MSGDTNGRGFPFSPMAPGGRLNIHEKFRDQLLHIHEKFRDLPDIFVTSNGYKTDWEDNKLLISYPGIKLMILDDNEVVNLGSQIFTFLSTQGTNQAVGSLLILAWNLRSSVGKTPLFPAIDITNTANHDLDLANLSNGIHASWDGGQIFPTSRASVDQQACGYAYTAAAFLKMFTKNPNNFSNSWDRVKQYFPKVYGFPYPFPYMRFDPRAINYIHDTFSRLDQFRNSLKSFLFVHDRIETDKGLRSYLYEQHLAYTGMHAYHLFIKIRDKMPVGEEKLLSAIDDDDGCRYTRFAVSELRLILSNFGSPPPGVETEGKKTWKYARLFDPAYFARIQTKNCAECVAILARVYEKCGARDEEGNLNNIVHVKNLQDQRKAYCKSRGDRIYDYLKMQ